MEDTVAPLVGGGGADNPTKEGQTRPKDAKSPRGRIAMTLAITMGAGNAPPLEQMKGARATAAGQGRAPNGGEKAHQAERGLNHQRPGVKSATGMGRGR